MTRLFKVALTATSALLLAVLLFIALHPGPARAFVHRYLSSRSDKFEPRLASSGANALPSVIFWAWERPEDLRFLDAHQAAVAFLAKTIYFTTQRSASDASPVASFVVRPRLQPLGIAPGSQLIAVVRIETQPTPRLAPASLHRANSSATISYSADLRDSLASEISDLQYIPGVTAIQIDFDATTRQHSFYAALLQDVRRKMSASVPLSITALASWCIGDPWLAQLPSGTIDEAVPMLFRMGPASGDVVKFLRSGHDFPVASCRASLGLSTDEPLSQMLLNDKLPGLSAPLRSKRIYIFTPRAWTQSVAQKILKELY